MKKRNREKSLWQCFSRGLKGAALLSAGLFLAALIVPTVHAEETDAYAGYEKGSSFYDRNSYRTLTWATRNSDGAEVVFDDGTPLADAFVCDGEYTYYVQADGTIMKDRLTYHPDGEHIIFFDDQGHEVFNDFSHVGTSISGQPVDDYCYFGSSGYMYVNTVTYNQDGTKLFYINPFGQMQHTGLFYFDVNAKYGEDDFWFMSGESCLGYASYDGNILRSTSSYLDDGTPVFFMSNGELYDLRKGLPSSIGIKNGHIYYDDDPYVAYMVEMSLREAGVNQGMSADQRVRTIYHWMLYNFTHNGDNPVEHYDLDAITWNAQVYRLYTDMMVSMGLAQYAYMSDEYTMDCRDGVCTGITGAFIALASAAGVDCDACTGYYLNRNGSTRWHAWPYAIVDGVDYYYDIDVEIQNKGKGQGDWYWYKKTRAEAEKTHAFDQ